MTAGGAGLRGNDCRWRRVLACAEMTVVMTGALTDVFSTHVGTDIAEDLIGDGLGAFGNAVYLR